VYIKKISCGECISVIRAEKGKQLGDVYFDNQQRNGLSVATDSVMFIFLHTRMCSILEFILNDETCLPKFLNCAEQKILLCKLTVLSIQSDYYFQDFLETCNCVNNHNSIL
jgi:hypothetical protein